MRSLLRTPSAERGISPTGWAADVRHPTGAMRRGGAQANLPRLKMRLVANVLKQGVCPDSARLVRQAANAAEALAWETPYPLLVFPCLFGEKVLEARTGGGEPPWLLRPPGLREWEGPLPER